MTATNLRGRVESIRVYEDQEQGRVSCGSSYHPVFVEATLEIEGDERFADGTKVYVKTQVGEKVYHSDLGPSGSEFFHVGPSQFKAPFPFVIQGCVKIAAPVKGSIFEGTTCYPHSEAIPVVWREDLLTVRGSVQERTSAKGNKYLKVARAIVTEWERTDW